MRSLFFRMALTGMVGVAISGCGTGGAALPVNTAFDSGGGVTNVSNQAPASGLEPGLLIDGGTKTYSGFDVTATDTLLPTAAQPTDALAKTAPADVAGSHSIAFTGNGLTQQIFAYSGGTSNLTLPVATPGDIMPVDYGAIVFFATPPASASSLSIELTGGAGATSYDVRVACTAKAVAAMTQTLADRYVCPLPAYGAASSTNIVNPVTAASATGAFTPQAAKLYIVLNNAAPLASTATGTLLLDYLFAEQGTT